MECATGTLEAWVLPPSTVEQNKAKHPQMDVMWSRKLVPKNT